MGNCRKVLASNQFKLFVLLAIGVTACYLLATNDDFHQPVTKSHRILLTNSDGIRRTIVPSTQPYRNVFYVPCGKKVFDFKHFFSVKSILRFLGSDNVVLYYETEPTTDAYNT